MGNHVWWPMGWGPMVAMEMGSPLSWCVPLFLFIKQIVFSFTIFLISFLPPFFTIVDPPLLEEHYQGWIKATLEFALTIDDFDELVDPHCLYECCPGPEPFAYVLKKIAQEEKSRFLILRSFLSFLIIFTLLTFFLQKWPLGTAKTSMPVLRAWRMNPYFTLPLDQRNAS